MVRAEEFASERGWDTLHLEVSLRAHGQYPHLRAASGRAGAGRTQASLARPRADPFRHPQRSRRRRIAAAAQPRPCAAAAFPLLRAARQIPAPPRHPPPLHGIAPPRPPTPPTPPIKNIPQIPPPQIPPQTPPIPKVRPPAAVTAGCRSSQPSPPTFLLPCSRSVPARRYLRATGPPCACTAASATPPSAPGPPWR